MNFAGGSNFMPDFLGSRSPKVLTARLPAKVAGKRRHTGQLFASVARRAQGCRCMSPNRNQRSLNYEFRRMAPDFLDHRSQFSHCAFRPAVLLAKQLHMGRIFVPAARYAPCRGCASPNRHADAVELRVLTLDPTLPQQSRPQVLTAHRSEDFLSKRRHIGGIMAPLWRMSPGRTFLQGSRLPMPPERQTPDDDGSASPRTYA